MSDILVVAGSRKGEWSVIFRFDVPTGTNAVGVTYQNALRDSGKASVSRLPDSMITQAEKDSLAAGITYEVTKTFDLSRVTGTNAEKNAKRIAILRDGYESCRLETERKLQGQLQYFGFSTTRS